MDATDRHSHKIEQEDSPRSSKDISSLSFRDFVKRLMRMDPIQTGDPKEDATRMTAHSRK